MKSFNEVKTRLNNLLFQNFDNSGIIAAIIFGSSVKETYHPESDIDIAILFDLSLDKVKQDDLTHQIFKKIPYYFLEPVDLINLNCANLFLSYQILTKGKVISCRNEREFKLFRDAKIIQYLDFKKFLEPHYPRISSKLKEEV